MVQLAFNELLLVEVQGVFEEGICDFGGIVNETADSLEEDVVEVEGVADNGLERIISNLESLLFFALEQDSQSAS